ncbi:MAG: 2'-deoxycytidine 5'-triphosphate deaminase [Pseudomonadota bacterium]
MTPTLPHSMTADNNDAGPASRTGHGVIPSQHLRRMISDGAITADTPVQTAQLQPASLDLRLGRRAWRVSASFLPGRRSVEERLHDFAMHQIDLAPGAVLERGCAYVVECAERLALPADTAGAANAKSSTGRLDLLTRLVTDGSDAFDRVAAGYHGPLYLQISPCTFSVLVRPGVTLSQLRLRRGEPALDDAALAALHGSDPLVDGTALIDGGLGFSVDLSGDAAPEGIVGWRARRNTALIDLDKIAAYDPADFWEAVRPARHRGLILDPGAFYILVSREAVAVPPETAAEMVPFMAVAGEFRVHYAGFFDPGFGHRETGGSGSRGVLEVRCHEAPFALEHGQSVGRLIYERMAERPDLLYGRDIGSNYQGQALKLSKHFRVPIAG